MKYIAAFVVLVVLSGFSLPVFAETVVRTGEVVSIADDQRVEGNFYALGSSVSLSGVVAGDVIAAAGTVSINAPVEHDVLALAGTVGINATVTEDVRIVAGDVTISEAVGGSIFVLGGRLTLLSTAVVQGDVLVLAGDVVINGTVHGDLLGVAERVRVDGVVGSVDMETPALVLGDRAEVRGDVKYTSAAELVRAPGAVVSGNVVRNDAGLTGETVSYRNVAMAFLVSLFASLSLYLVARKPLALYARQATHNVAREAFIGFALLVAVPIAIVVLMVSVLGLFLGLIGLTIFLMAIMLALPLMNIIAGTLIGRTFQHTHEVNILLITLGALTVQAMLFVPVIGPILLFVLFLITIGGIATALYRLLKMAS